MVGTTSGWVRYLQPNPLVVLISPKNPAGVRLTLLPRCIVELLYSKERGFATENALNWVKTTHASQACWGTTRAGESARLALPPRVGRMRCLNQSQFQGSDFSTPPENGLSLSSRRASLEAPTTAGCLERPSTRAWLVSTTARQAL